MTPRDLLRTAGDLCTNPPVSMRRCWQRAVASLTRTALEQALSEHWAATVPSLVGRPTRHQLLAMPVLIGLEAADVARVAWYGLSRAVHHHTYELAPTVAELQGWHQEVTTLLTYLEPASRTAIR